MCDLRCSRQRRRRRRLRSARQSAPAIAVVFKDNKKRTVNKHKFGGTDQKKRMKAENKIKDEDKFRRAEVRPKAGGKVGRPAESASQLTNGVRNVTEVKLVTLTVFHPFLVIFFSSSTPFSSLCFQFFFLTGRFSSGRFVNILLNGQRHSWPSAYHPPSELMNHDLFIDSSDDDDRDIRWKPSQNRSLFW